MYLSCWMPSREGTEVARGLEEVPSEEWPRLRAGQRVQAAVRGHRVASAPRE